MRISWGGVLLRMLGAIALVLLTFNPTGHSFYHWLSAPPAGITPLKALAGIALLIGWIVWHNELDWLSIVGILLVCAGGILSMVLAPEAGKSHGMLPTHGHGKSQPTAT